MTTITRSPRWQAAAAALLVVLGALPASAAEPACPAGEITLSASL